MEEGERREAEGSCTGLTWTKKTHVTDENDLTGGSDP